MEPNESGLSSYYHHHQPPLQPPPHLLQQPPSSAATASTTITATASGASPINGVFPNNNAAVSYPHSVPSALSSPLDTVRRKRGRPRKYGTPEQAAAAKRLAAANSGQNSAKKRDHSVAGGGGGAAAGASPASAISKKTQLAALGSAGQGFNPHIITVSAGEDVGQKIMLFMQQNKRELCILSAAGSIANASLRQPATSGGSITYEGCFDILSLSGSYVCTELGGRTGGLSVCLSNTDGQIIGGGVGGPLTAAGPVQVIVGTFLIDSKKDATAGTKSNSGGKLSSPVGGTSISSSGFQLAVDQQNFGGQFMIQARNMQMTPPPPTDWRVGADSRGNSNYDFTGRTGHGAHQSPENGDYEQMAD